MPSEFPYNCVICDYHTSSKSNFEKHLNTKKHLNQNPPKKSETMSLFECIPCKYKTTDKSNYERHLKNIKHLKKNPSSPDAIKYELHMLMGSIRGCEDFIKRYKGKKWHDKDKQRRTEEEIQRKEEEIKELKKTYNDLYKKYTQKNPPSSSVTSAAVVKKELSPDEIKLKTTNLFVEIQAHKNFIKRSQDIKDKDVQQEIQRREKKIIKLKKEFDYYNKLYQQNNKQQQSKGKEKETIKNIEKDIEKMKREVEEESAQLKKEKQKLSKIVSKIAIYHHHKERKNLYIKNHYLLKEKLKNLKS